MCLALIKMGKSRAQRRIHGAVQRICTFFGICAWLLILDVKAGSIPLWSRLTDASETLDVQGQANDSFELIRHNEGKPNSEWVWNSSFRGLLESRVQENTVSLGLMNEDGSFNSGFMSEEHDGKWDVGEDDLLFPDDPVSSMGDAEIRLPGFTIWTAISSALNFDKCSLKMKDFIPCLDWQPPKKEQSAALGNRRGERERHCPPERADADLCLVAKPTGYRAPIRWPRSKNEVLVVNLPQPGRTLQKQGMVSIDRDKWKFPTTESHFLEGISANVDHLIQIIPGLGLGVRTRTALDIGCGVANFGATLLDHDVLPLSVSAKDDNNNGVQFALERGLPAMLVNLGTRRLPFPSQAFDLIHCSGSVINWIWNGRAALLELDRVLRAGGHFVWWVAPVTGNTGRDAQMWREVLELTGRMCWTLVTKDGRLAVWQKSLNRKCYEDRAEDALPALCPADDDSDKVWYVSLDLCVSRIARNFLQQTPNWPARLSVFSERPEINIMDAGESRPDVFLANQRQWKEIVEGYLRGLGMRKSNVRNVMDMRAGFGGFAAAVVDQNPGWWVMNVVSPHGPNSLPMIYDRGLIGVAHDWCEPFDTYPRTYDLLHAVGVFSTEEKRCNITHIMLEMDRILRPYGWVLIRESKAKVEQLEPLAKAVRWKTRILETESGPYGKDKLLACIKRK